LAQIYAGDAHSFAISLNGKLWGWGENVDYMLGGTNDDDVEDLGNRKTTTHNVTTSAAKKKVGGKLGTLYKPTELKVNKNLVVCILLIFRE
jgi:alpha-tubulin suppressor-like RCC1 family protein